MDVKQKSHTNHIISPKYPTSPRNHTSYKTTRFYRMRPLYQRKVIKIMKNCSKNLPRTKIHIKMATSLY